MKSLFYLNKYLYKYKWRLLAGGLFVILSNLLNVFSVIAVRYAFNLIDEGLEMGNLLKELVVFDDFKTSFRNIIIIYIALYFLVKFISAFFLYLTRQTIIVMSRLIENDLKNEIYAHYQQLPLKFYNQNRTGDLMARISEDVSKVRMYLGPGIMYGINMISLFSITISFMLAVNVQLTIYTLFPLPILSITIYYVSDKINKHSTIIQQRLSGLSNFVQEAFSGIRILKSFVREEDSFNKFVEESENYKKESIKLEKINSLFAPLIFLLIGLSTAVTIFIGGKEVVSGNITIGNIAEFVIYINMLTWPVASLGWITSIIQRAAASQTRINEFLKIKTDIVSTKNSETPLEGKIEFKNVTVYYPESEVTALSNVNFSIEKGHSVGIIGSTGSGKSTIASSILRLFDCTKGEILIDGTPIEEFNVNHLRQHIGYVPQDVFLFSDTIKENVAFGKTNASEEEIIQATKDAGVYDNITNFPNQFETLVGERGITLSGGQKQRISIARAIIKQPEILIFDDCLSAVDTKTEDEILNNLKRIMKNKTSIIIAHRVSTIQWVDKILVLAEGKILEEGSHQDLMHKKGFYFDLYQKQILN